LGSISEKIYREKHGIEILKQVPYTDLFLTQSQQGGNAMAIYIKMDTISGNVTSEGYENWIEAKHVRFPGISTQVSNNTGNGYSRITGKPYFGELTVIKQTDNSTTTLFENAHSGKVIGTVEIDFVSTSNPPQAYEKFKLTNVIISHFSKEHHEGGGLPVEFIKLNYTKIEHTYIPRNSANQLQSPQVTGYDIEQATST